MGDLCIFPAGVGDPTTQTYTIPDLDEKSDIKSYKEYLIAWLCTSITVLGLIQHFLPSVV
jgi:hypothetical protein